MAGQLIFTKGPVRQGERAWIMRAMMSLPVPLSPWISTGTLALATLSMRSRSDCMTSERPNVIASGGNSPREVASEVTDGVVVMSILVAHCPCVRALLCTPRAKLQPALDSSPESKVTYLDLYSCMIFLRNHCGSLKH